MLSWYTFFGRRYALRRISDQGKGGYVDRYSPRLLFFIVLMMGLNILDVLFTLMILDHKGWEFNPIVRSAIEIHGDQFWVWKFSIMSLSLILLCLHSKFRMAKMAIVALCSVYFLVILYEIVLLISL